MSVTTVRTMHCDRCHQWEYSDGDGLGTAAQVRAAARRRGWRVGSPHDEDVCPPCVRKEAQP